MEFRTSNKKGRFVSGITAAASKKRKLFVEKNAVNSDVSDETVLEGNGTTHAMTPQSDGLLCWNDGRRIVELGHLAKQMRCTDCHELLDLQATESETRRGFGSTLYIMCTCGIINSVTTNKTHHLKKKGAPVFDVNSKAAMGMLHSGSGHRQIQQFLSTLEIPTISFNSMKERELEVGSHVKKIAEQSCSDALQLEKSLIETPQRQPTCSETNQCEENIQVKYDMGWQKRGSGRCYDSLSGVGTMIGNQSGKIVAFDVRSKDCRKCTYYASKSMSSPEHDCSKNWNGSSKAMEPDVGACLVEQLEKQDVIVGTLIMDDDCTTMAKIKQVAKTEVTKWSDINHSKKHLGNSMYKLQTKHKQLTVKVIQYFQKCFSYAVAQNKNDPSGLARALNQIVPHAFGNHEDCDTTWCTYHRDPAGYKHSSLPYGRSLSEEVLKNDLVSVFQVFVQNVKKISPGASTKDVESFNNMVASKAPKRCHYSSSSSLKHRVECAVAQKNLGFKYVNEVNKSLGVSPGNVYKKMAQKLNKIKNKRLVFESSKAFKKMKLDKKLNRKRTTIQKELREGVTYKTAVATTSISDVSEIPQARVSPVKEYINNITECTQVFCDIETTSLHKLCDLTQIAAVCGKNSFNKYILPDKPISPAASQVTGLTVSNNEMYYNGKRIETFSLHEALTLFLSWLDEMKPCILVGHNFSKFDFPRLLRVFESCNLLSSFQAIVSGIIDTLPLFKKVYPNLDSYSQQNIVSKVLNENYAAHNALADVESLAKLVNASNISGLLLDQSSISTKSFVQCYFHDKITDENVYTLEILTREKIVSNMMAKKIAASGLNLVHLKLAVSRGGEEGLSQLFGEKLSTGKPRVTSVKSIVQKVYNYISSNNI